MTAAESKAPRESNPNRLPRGLLPRPAFRSAAAVIATVALVGCAGKEPPPVDNAFCRVYVRLPDPADAVNMKKRENKIAILTNEQSADRECLGDRSNSLGPR